MYYRVFTARDSPCPRHLERQIRFPYPMQTWLHPATRSWDSLPMPLQWQFFVFAHHSFELLARHTVYYIPKREKNVCDINTGLKMQTMLSMMFDVYTYYQRFGLYYRTGHSTPMSSTYGSYHRLQFRFVMSKVILSCTKGKKTNQFCLRLGLRTHIRDCFRLVEDYKIFFHNKSSIEISSTCEGPGSRWVHTFLLLYIKNFIHCYKIVIFESYTKF